MNDIKQKEAAKKFADFWKDKGYEKGESQSFWLSLLHSVLGVENPEQFISFENQVMLDHTSFIDGFIDTTHVMIEQKGLGKDLLKPIKQSDGTLLTPFQQAKRYAAELPYSKRPRWIVTCNFAEFLVYDMEKPTGEPERILLENLEKEYYRLNFLTDTGDVSLRRETELSMKAGEIVGILYDKLLMQYKNPDENSLKSLNALCVRLVFCLYAEDANIFGRHMLFHDYLRDIPASGIRRALAELFKILDTPEEKRDKYLADDNPRLAAFPYVNGGLFADEEIEIPPFTEELKELLLHNASEDFDWSDISPTIFGAVFESTLNPETRRSGGMHYTSIENIHKVIDPLFLDDLTRELDEILEIQTLKTKKAKLESFIKALSELSFLDPACGSGNFLTETYLSLRRLENRALDAINQGQITLDTGNLIQVSIGQFYGIEINDFAVTVAKTALWIAESQMMRETEEIVHMSLDFLPLKSYANIVEGNALRMDWNEIVPKERLSYIMGNPPFVGMKYQDKGQKSDMAYVSKDVKNYGSLDYVTSWFIKTASYTQDTKIVTAFVATNSIVQGEQASILWSFLFDKGMQIVFAYKTFIWNSEAKEKAAVHCVIVGFTYAKGFSKYIFQDNRVANEAKNINQYLIDAPNIIVSPRTKPICNVPKIIAGNKPVDGDFLKIEKKDYPEFVKKEPAAKQYIKKLIGGYEFINNAERYVLWLVDVPPSKIREMPLVYDRVKKVREARLAMKDAGAIKLADTPTTFRDTLNPEHYIVVPIVSSENRRYIPIGFLDKSTIPTNQVQIIPNATLYHFGVLTSNVHMAWVRAVCGRLKSDYRYTGKIVYNNFPWCNPTDEQRAQIERTAQGILDARALYPDSSLADLYDELTMPPELRRAHQQNDRAVMQAYGFDVKTMTESECVAELMKMYKELTNGLLDSTKPDGLRKI